ASKYQETQNSAQVSLFGDASEVQIPEPEVPPCEEWGTMKKLKHEKEVVGVYISGHPLDDFKIDMETFTNCNVSAFHYLKNHINKELCFGGIVSQVIYRTSKNGRDWAIFTVEDFEDSYDFRIYGEEYLKFRHLLVLDSFIYGRVFVKEGWTDRETGKKSDPRMQFNHIQILQDVMDKYSKKITLEIPLNILNERRIDFIKSHVKSNKGEKQLFFVVYDNEEKINLTMPSRRHKINISKKLLNELEAEQLSYKLN